MGVSGGHTHLHHYPRTMSFNLFGLNSASKAQFNGKTAARTKAMLAAAVVSLAGLGLMLPENAFAAFYGADTTLYSDGFNGEAVVGSNGVKQSWLHHGSSEQLATAGCRGSRKKCRSLNK